MLLTVQSRYWISASCASPRISGWVLVGVVRSRSWRDKRARFDAKKKLCAPACANIARVVCPHHKHSKMALCATSSIMQGETVWQSLWHHTCGNSLDTSVCSRSAPLWTSDTVLLDHGEWLLAFYSGDSLIGLAFTCRPLTFFDATVSTVFVLTAKDTNICSCREVCHSREISTTAWLSSRDSGWIHRRI